MYIDGVQLEEGSSAMDWEMPFLGSISPEGQFTEILQAGEKSAELVDRNCWAFTGDEYLQVNDQDHFDNDEMTIAVGFKTRTANGRLLDQGGGSSTGSQILFINGSKLRTYYGKNGGETSAMSTGISSDGNWRVGQGSKAADGLVRVVLDSEVVTNGPDVNRAGTISSVGHIYVGGYGGASGAADYEGLIDWVAYFPRLLTSVEEADLAAWDGTVANEPSWLRTDPNLVLYLNADDDLQVGNYSNDDVINLVRSAQPIPLPI